jgi:hypothetical protein
MKYVYQIVSMILLAVLIGLLVVLISQIRSIAMSSFVVLIIQFLVLKVVLLA